MLFEEFKTQIRELVKKQAVEEVAEEIPEYTGPTADEQRS